MIKNDNDNSSADPFKVYIRVRPFLEKELISDGDNSSNNLNNNNRSLKAAVVTDENMVYVVEPDSPELYGKRERCFVFDDVFKEKDNNVLIFNKVVKNLVNNVFSGYNSTALAYGVTGTGKTHTMFGDIYV